MEVLSRVYRIGNFTWTPGMANVYFSFPDSLAPLSVISAYLTPFEYFRSGIRLQVRLNSTPYHQGALILGALPTINLSATSGINLWTVSGLKPVVLSASVQDSCTYDLPYLNPAAWLRQPLTVSSTIGSFVLAELNPLITTSSDIPAAVQVTVFASFLNPKVAQFNETVSAQSSDSSRFSVKGRNHTFSLIDGNYSAISNKEAKKKAEDGVDSKGIQKIVGGVSEIIKMIPIVGDIYRPIAHFISTYGKNLDLPTDTSAVQTIFDYPFRYQNQTRGLFMGEKFTMYPSSQLAMEDMGMETSEMPVATIAQTPMLAYQKIYTSQGQTFHFDVNPMAALDNAVGNTTDYLQFMAAHFEYWRGSIKYLFHFVSCAFYSTRFQLAYQLNNDANIDANIPNQIIDVKGDTMVEVTIPYLWYTHWRRTGTTPTTLPTLQLRMLTPIAGSGEPASPLIYVNVWRAGGEDIQFAQLKNSQNTLPWNAATTTTTTTITSPVSKTEIRAQTSICSRFKAKFAPIIENSQYSMEVGNCQQELPLLVKDVIRRFSLMDPRNWQTLVDFSIPYAAPFVTAPFYAEPFSAMGHIFLFWRGSRRFRVSPNASDNIVLNSFDSSMVPTPGSGMVISNCNVVQSNTGENSSLVKTEFEVPYFSEVPYFPIFRPIVPLAYVAGYDLPVGITVNFHTDTTLPYLLTWAAGDDFQYLYLIPPLFPAPSTKKARAALLANSKRS